jgi:formylglycine-generating enzyme required for sulfatase activity
MPAGVFISYRRIDATKDARAVYERLGRELGTEHVFIDLEGLNYGEDFVEALERQLADCQVLLALIGPQWLLAADGKDRRRLDTRHDFVRTELRTALARPGVRVVPVLIDGTDLPTEDELPEDLHLLLRRHAFPLRFANFDADMRHLVGSLRRMLATPPPVTAAQTAVGTPAQAAPALPGRPAWASADGRDDHGRWAEFTVAKVVQRLRWIAPGEFLMGSPADEPQRYDDEGPQHRVRISEGFWLADSACTQALWLAVLGGKNPARFNDDLACPVEQVSHDDVLTFLDALKGKLSGSDQPVLPTEAQWEYACRAGTTTPFSFGAQILPEQANYDGNLPYNGAPKGRFRKRTVPVKSLPANPWGLYEMHGNVWEWCADGAYRPYPTLKPGQVAEDPLQPPEQGPEAHRVIRGGSWVNGARDLRSAYRNAGRRGDRDRNLGFRLALRSAA